MKWELLDTRLILKIKYYPAEQKLKAHLRTGHTEIYAPISEARYQELKGSRVPHDIDTFFSNMVRPSKVSRRPTIRYRARRIARSLAFAIVVVGILALFGLWNSGLLYTYFAGLSSVHS